MLAPYVQYPPFMHKHGAIVVFVVVVVDVVVDVVVVVVGANFLF